MARRRSDSNCRKRALFFGDEVIRWQRRKFAGYALELADFLRGCARVVLRNLDQGLGHADDEGVGLAVGLVVVVAKNLLEVLRPDQVGQRGNFFAILNQDGSTKAQVFVLLTTRGGSKGALGRLRPLVEEIGISTSAR